MEQFYTRQKANEGIEVPLYLPDGTKSEESLSIRGIDSDIFRAAESEAKRKSMEVALIEDEAERKEASAEQRRGLIASLVISWTFDKECTLENVKDFLREAPQIADQIDQVAARRSLFFAKGLSSSTNSPKASSRSTASRKAQKSARKSSSNKSTKQPAKSPSS